MAGELEPQPKRRKRRVPRKRRSAASGGTPARSRAKSGNPGYAGYEYQIEVTVWVALDLLLAKGATDEIAVEPRSDEDLEAAIEDPSAASLGLTAEGKRLDLILQAKTRSGSPWSATAIADVLLGKESDRAAKGSRRSRPIHMLQATSSRRYVFVTNEASVEGLRPHEGEHLFDFPEVDELPPHCRTGYDATTRADLAPRILLLTGVTREVLKARIDKLLSQHGHVPASNHADCLRDLRDAVRQRIMGANEGRWNRSELLHILVRHGGSAAPTRDMDHYVRPKSFDAIKNRLDTSHAAIIVGPSGTGKTLTADILECDLRQGIPPFDVIGEEHGPGYVRSHLTQSGSILFHLRDPWGSNRLMPGADRWSGELPKLLDSAGPDRKFLITSRSDVLQSAGYDLMRDLRPYVVAIELEDYGPNRLGEIYDGIAADLSGHAGVLARKHRYQALEELKRPYEIKRFLVALSGDNGKGERKINEIITDSQIEAISRVIADQLSPFGRDGAESAAIIWAMLAARGAVARNVFSTLGRRLRALNQNLRPDLDGLIDFLVAGQNLRQDGTALSFHHPRVEDGLRRTFLRWARDAELALSSVVDVLVRWDERGEDWGLETGVEILRATANIANLHLEVSSSAQGRLDVHLDAVALTANKRTDFERALGNLERFGSPNHLPARLARILTEAQLETDTFMSFEHWQAPDITENEITALRGDSRTNKLINRFIREVLPFTRRNYDPELVSLVGKIGTDFRDAFWDALDIIGGPGGPHENIGTIVAGALSDEIPDYDRAIERFARSEADADKWLESFADETYQAEEHAIDADAEDHVIDEPGDYYFNGHEGMKAVVNLRRVHDGVNWIADSPHRKLLVCTLAGIIADSSHTPKLEELVFLLDHSEGSVRDEAWRAVEQHWNDELSGCLLLELEHSHLKSAMHRQRLLQIAAVHSGVADPVSDLLDVFDRMTPERRLEVIYDIMMARLDGDAEGTAGVATRHARARRLVKMLSGAAHELADALIAILLSCKISAVSSAASALSGSARSLLDSTLQKCSIDLTGPLACLAGAADLDITGVAERLLSTEDARDGLIALDALRIAGGSNLRTSMQKALTHKRYDVRRKALRILVPDATSDERKYLISASSDASAEMRLAFARLMQEYNWPEAVAPLNELLSDTRDFGSRLATDGAWSRFSVARAAAQALGTFEKLPNVAIDALLERLRAPSADPFVACACLLALAEQDDARITPALLESLHSHGLFDDIATRPRAHAAAWALCDRAMCKRLNTLDDSVADVAKGEGSKIAAPLLMTFGALGGEPRKKLLKELRAAKQPRRETLVRMAAIEAQEVDDLSLDDRERVLLRLAQGVSLAELERNERAMIEKWSQGLDVNKGFERFVAWFANVVFGLPLSEDVDNVRAFDVPGQIGTVTMRSLSPYREDEPALDDGT